MSTIWSERTNTLTGSSDSICAGPNLGLICLCSGSIVHIKLNISNDERYRAVSSIRFIKEMSTKGITRLRHISGRRQEGGESSILLK